jgi:hypothetical protein
MGEMPSSDDSSEIKTKAPRLSFLQNYAESLPSCFEWSNHFAGKTPSIKPQADPAGKANVSKTGILSPRTAQNRPIGLTAANSRC